MVALGTGNLARCIELAAELASTRSLLMADSAVSLASHAALLACNERALRSAVEIGQQHLHRAPGTALTADLAGHYLELLKGGAPSAPDIGRADNPYLSGAELGIMAREALAAGNYDIARSVVARAPELGDWARAVAALIQGHINQDAGGWHDALALAARHDLRLIAADALEAIGVGAAESESWAECLRLAGAAKRVREETGYKWRFQHEQRALDSAIASARNALGPEPADTAEAEGSGMTWQHAVAYAQRARGERRRPSHGWASLTPTEAQVVNLVVEGLTNPQIADRLLMGRATVKTHLQHVFAKLGVSSRTELAAQAARRA